MHAVTITFSLAGMSDAAYRALADDLAPSFAAVPGLRFKLWLADADAGTYGGMYLFETTADAAAYLASDAVQGGVVRNPAFAGVRVTHAPVLAGPSRVTAAIPPLVR